MENIVITIARQYGSGGKTVGQMVAKELGIPFYSRDILRLASEDSGISEGLFGEADEKLKKKVIFWQRKMSPFISVSFYGISRKI